MTEKKLIDLYPYRIDDGEVTFLLFKRAKGKIYEGQWRMIGGKVEPGETYWEAALRELLEETALTPSKMWTIPSLNLFYEHSSDSILQIPAFAAEIDRGDAIRLDREHTEYSWVEHDEVSEYLYWPEQIRLIRLTNELIKNNKILNDWRVPLS
ncbi:MAG: NUDIX domain-containing protein [Bacteroidota bacterium]